jgi:hypothetical protein
MPEVIELTRQEGMELLDEAARRKLGISGEDFLRRHDAGELDQDDLAVLDLEILIPFAR